MAGKQIGGVIDDGAVSCRRQGKRGVIRWQRHRGSVGFEKEAIQGQMLEDFQASDVSRIQMVTVEREKGTQFEEPRNQLGGARVRVDEKTAAGQGT